VPCARSATNGPRRGGSLSVGSTSAAVGQIVPQRITHALNDLSDISFVKRGVYGYLRDVQLSGPGTIVAVDSGSSSKNVRGNTRSTMEARAYALVQATGGRNYSR